jgi:hypothetical protein
VALVRCESCGPPRGLKCNYNHSHAVVPSVNESIICGSSVCIHPGSLWLTDEEQREYLAGRRSFRTANRNRAVEVI